MNINPLAPMHAAMDARETPAPKIKLRTLQDEAFTLRDLLEALTNAALMLPRATHEHPDMTKDWHEIDMGLDELIDTVKAALKKIGATDVR